MKSHILIKLKNGTNDWKRVQTWVIKSGSRHLRDFSLVERNGGYEWLLLFCLASDHVKPSSQRWRAWEEKQGGGSRAPRREKVCKDVRFWRGSNREEDLSPGVTLLPNSYLLFLIHPGLSVFDLKTYLHLTWGWRRAFLSCFCLFLGLIVSTLFHRLDTVF